MKKIIVPVDFSKQSDHALQYAAGIAKKYDCEILALHMLELSPALLTNSEITPSENTVFLLKLAEKRFGEFLDKDYLALRVRSPFSGVVVILLGHEQIFTRDIQSQEHVGGDVDR